jgi:glutamate 5-kinase
VTSGAVAFGKQLLKNKFFGTGIDPRASSAVGQGGLIATYDFMFQQYGIQLALVLVTKNDLKDPIILKNLQETLSELLAMRIIPIINENDAISAPAKENADLEGVISVTDNDSLAATIGVRMNANLVMLLTDVDGIYEYVNAHLLSATLLYRPLPCRITRIILFLFSSSCPGCLRWWVGGWKEKRVADVQYTRPDQRAGH